MTDINQNKKEIKKLKVMKASPLIDVNKEKKNLLQNPVNIGYNERPTLQPKSAKDDSKEIQINCPHCSKRLYIKRNTDKCIYCKEQLSEDLVVSLFLRHEELEREKIKKENLQVQQNLQHYVNSKQLPKKKSKKIPLFLIISLLSYIYYVNYVDLDSEVSVPYYSSPTVTPFSESEAYDINYILNILSPELNKNGMSFEISDANHAVIIHIDSTSSYGAGLKIVLDDKDLVSAVNNDYLLQGIKDSNDYIADFTSSAVGFDVKFLFIFDSDYSNIIYTVIGNHNTVI